MGNYDGVHRGHQTILGRLVREAKKKGLKAVVYTFDPHPVKILAPQIAPPLINTPAQKIELIAKTGVDLLIFEKFNLGFSRLGPEVFFKKIVTRRLKAHYITVGYDFTFGKKREGNIETLEWLCFKGGIDVHIVKAQMVAETLVSSSLIRKHLMSGRVDQAIPLLGSPFFIDGKVVPGQQRGKLVGIHTANIKTDNSLWPDDGVYATRVRLGKKIYPSATNIGFNPTFGNQVKTMETHIFGLNKNIHEQPLRLFFIKKIRDEKKFETPKELSRQIHKDIARCRQILKK